MIKVLVYCASGAGERVAYTLDEEVYEVVGLVDSNSETWGKPLYGIGGGDFSRGNKGSGI